MNDLKNKLIELIDKELGGYETGFLDSIKKNIIIELKEFGIADKKINEIVDRIIEKSGMVREKVKRVKKEKEFFDEKEINSKPIKLVERYDDEGNNLEIQRKEEKENKLKNIGQIGIPYSQPYNPIIDNKEQKKEGESFLDNPEIFDTEMNIERVEVEKIDKKKKEKKKENKEENMFVDEDEEVVSIDSVLNI